MALGALATGALVLGACQPQVVVTGVCVVLAEREWTFFDEAMVSEVDSAQEAPMALSTRRPIQE